MGNQAIILKKKNKFFDKARTVESIEKKFAVKSIPVEQVEITPGKEKIFTTRQKNFYLVATNKSLYSQEFTQHFESLKDKELFDSLKDSSQQTSNEQWLYCYWLCLTMKLYYEGYGQTRKVEKYEKLAKNIKARCQGTKFPKVTKENKTFIQYLIEKASKELDKIKNTPSHLEDLRSWDGFLNLVRLYYTFCRLMMTNGLLLARSTNILEKLDKALGLHTDVDQIISVLNGPSSVFRGLSVGFFVVRIVLNTASLMKHTCFPSEEELKLTWQQRLAFEIKKRHMDYVNDFVWAAINAITNYNGFFHIAGASAGFITAGVLFFDILWLLYRLKGANDHYMEKKQQYDVDLFSLRVKKSHPINKDDASQKKIQESIDIVEKQLHELELNWAVESHSLLFYTAGAFLLFSGFTASLFFTPLGAVVICYAVCTLAAGMYLSGEAYKEWEEKRLRLADVKTQLVKLENKTGDDPEFSLLTKKMRLLDQQYNQARNDFIWTLAKNTVIPALTIAVFAICWQAALVLVVAYLAYELYNAKQKKGVPEAIDDLAEEDEHSSVERESSDSLLSKDSNESLVNP